MNEDALTVLGVMPWNKSGSEGFAAAWHDLRQRLLPRKEAERRGDLAGSVEADPEVWAALLLIDGARSPLPDTCPSTWCPRGS